MATTIQLHAATSDQALVSKAVLRATDALGLSLKELAQIIGVSASQLSRARKHGAAMFPDAANTDQRVESALLLIRVYRSLCGLLGSDADAQQRWLRSHNQHLGDTPLNLLFTLTGKVRTVDYLDAMRGQ